MNEMNPILHTIRPGDTLYNLALQYGTTVQNIIDTNMALNPYDLRVGQQIYIYPDNAQNTSYWVSMNQVQFRRYYGIVVANKIQQLLTEHLSIGKDLIVALKNKNQEEATKLNTKWYQNADEMAEAFSSINPFYPKEEIRNMLYEHLRLITNEVNNRLQGNYVADINSYDMVQKEILKMSQFFVNGIVRQFPNLF